MILKKILILDGKHFKSVIYKKIAPPTHLQDFVECFFVWEYEPAKIELIESPPAGFSSIVFNYENCYKVKTARFKSHQKVPTIFIAGQSTSSYQLKIDKKIGMAGIVFKPAGLASLFSISLAELTDERMDFTNIFNPKKCKKILSQISKTDDQASTNVVRKNINLRVHQDIAWMTFDQYGEDTGDPSMDMPGLSRETRILEKQDGSWKIVYVGWLLEE